MVPACVHPLNVQAGDAVWESQDHYPSCSSKVITVGAHDEEFNQLANCPPGMYPSMQITFISIKM